MLVSRELAIIGAEEVPHTPVFLERTDCDRRYQPNWRGCGARVGTSFVRRRGARCHLTIESKPRVGKIAVVEAANSCGHGRLRVKTPSSRSAARPCVVTL